MQAALRKLTDFLAHLPDTPERIARAFAVGVFLGFSPFLGLQTLLGLVLAYAIGLSRVAVVAGTWVNLPWFVPFYYVLATEVGARLLGLDPPSGLSDDMRAVFAESGFGFGAIRRLVGLLWPMLWPFVLGSTLSSLVLAIVSHRVMLALLRVQGRISPGPPPDSADALP